MIYSILRIIKGAQNKKIVIPQSLWLQTWHGLRERSDGRVESAAVWGGKREDSTEIVEAVYFLNDYAPSVQQSGYHRVSTKALEMLFSQLKKERRVIVGDIHTHPTRWVGLSKIDKDNPIEFRPGIHAVVFPSFALPEPSLKSAGVHEYLGKGRWRELRVREKNVLFSFI